MDDDVGPGGTQTGTRTETLTFSSPTALGDGHGTEDPLRRRRPHRRVGRAGRRRRGRAAHVTRRLGTPSPTPTDGSSSTTCRAASSQFVLRVPGSDAPPGRSLRRSSSEPCRTHALGNPRPALARCHRAAAGRAGRTPARPPARRRCARCTAPRRSAQRLPESSEQRRTARRDLAISIAATRRRDCAACSRGEAALREAACARRARSTTRR